MQGGEHIQKLKLIVLQLQPANPAKQLLVLLIESLNLMHAFPQGIRLYMLADFIFA